MNISIYLPVELYAKTSPVESIVSSVTPFFENPPIESGTGTGDIGLLENPPLESGTGDIGLLENPPLESGTNDIGLLENPPIEPGTGM